MAGWELAATKAVGVDGAVVLFARRKNIGDDHLVGGVEAVRRFLKQATRAAIGVGLKDRPNTTRWETVSAPRPMWRGF